MLPTYLRHWIWIVPLFCIGCFSIPFTRSKPIDTLVEIDFALLPQPPEVDYANETSWAALPWRKDMADAIIFHSLTAFLDQHLKGDAAKGEWLAAAPDGTLKGFQNRWQLGISLTHTAAQ